MYDINPAGPMMHLRELERMASEGRRLRNVTHIGSGVEIPSKQTSGIRLVPLALLALLASFLNMMVR
jgi:hypothetical protein